MRSLLLGRDREWVSQKKKRLKRKKEKFRWECNQQWECDAADNKEVQDARSTSTWSIKHFFFISPHAAVNTIRWRAPSRLHSAHTLSPYGGLNTGKDRERKRKKKVNKVKTDNWKTKTEKELNVKSMRKKKRNEKTVFRWTAGSCALRRRFFTAPSTTPEPWWRHANVCVCVCSCVCVCVCSCLYAMYLPSRQHVKVRHLLC